MSILVYLTPIVLAAVGCGVFARDKTPSFVLGMLALLWALLVLIFRSDIGYDYHAYVAQFNAGYAPREPLAALFFDWNQIHGNPEYYIASLAILAWGFLIPAFRRRKDARFSILLFLTLPTFYLDYFSIMRQSVAVSICIYAVSLGEGRLRARAILAVLAVLMHASAVAFVLWLALFELQCRSRRAQFSILVGVAVLGYLAWNWSYLYEPSLLEVQLKFGFLSFYYGEHQFGVKLALLGIFLLFFSRISSNIDARALWSSLLVMSASLALTFIDGVFSRLSVYGLIPLLFVSWKIKWGNRDMAWPVLTFLGFTLCLAMLFIKSQVEFGPLLPYRTVFD